MSKRAAVFGRVGLIPSGVVRRVGVVAALLMLGPSSLLRAQPHEEAAVVDELQRMVEQLRAYGVLYVAGEAIPSWDLTLQVYEQRGFRPLWTDPSAVQGLLAVLDGVGEDGLDPEDYHRSILRRAALAWATGGGEDAANEDVLDLLATDALVRVSHDLRFGKVEPEGPATRSGTPWAFGGPDALARLTEAVGSGRVAEALAPLRPSHFVYAGLVRALAELRAIQDANGWAALPSGPPMGRDSLDARVPELRARLAVEGDLSVVAGGSEGDTGLRYDAELEAGVRSFQHRHGLNEDGVVGNETLAALNVPVDRRIDQVRVSLERTRWVAHELPDTFVVVNVAGARVYLVRGDSIAFETRAIVGANYTKTPVFTALMRYIDLNPTWTVPPGIVGEVLGLVRGDPGYLTRQGIRVLDHLGREVDVAGIDFSRYTAADFPYLFRQDPGPANALGEIKMMLPNEYYVYLHDTPTKGLFAREKRLFSHGCIRLQDPLGLAELVLGDPERWNRGTLRAAIDTKVTQSIPLTKPMPVYVLYWTAAVDPAGTVHFYDDVYERDAAVLAALDAAPADGTHSGASR